jgi:hypothetical protein
MNARECLFYLVGLTILPQIAIWPLLGMGSEKLYYGSRLEQALLWWLLFAPIPLIAALLCAGISAWSRKRLMIPSIILLVIGTLPWLIRLAFGY